MLKSSSVPGQGDHDAVKSGNALALQLSSVNLPEEASAQTELCAPHAEAFRVSWPDKIGSVVDKMTQIWKSRSSSIPKGTRGGSSKWKSSKPKRWRRPCEPEPSTKTQLPKRHATGRLGNVARRGLPSTFQEGKSGYLLVPADRPLMSETPTPTRFAALGCVL